jgi:hypothetical protein
LAVRGSFSQITFFFLFENRSPPAKHRPVFSWRNHFVVYQIKLILRISGNLKHHPPIKQGAGIAHDIDTRRHLMVMQGARGTPLYRET